MGLALALVHWMFLHLKFVEDSFITHNFETRLSEFDAIKYDSNTAFHCETWSFSLRNQCLLLPSLNDGFSVQL